ncbi:MAG: DUF5060 domain-containing protein [Verrucomicrobiota bacterium]
MKAHPLLHSILFLLASSPWLQAEPVETGRLAAPEFDIQKGFYIDQEKWLGVHPDHSKDGVATLVFPFRDGTYDVVLEMVGENDGQSSFQVEIEELVLGPVKAPPTPEMFITGPDFDQRWKGVEVNDGDLVTVRGQIHSADGKEWSRARWAALRFEPVDGGEPLVAMESGGTPELLKGPPLFGERLPDGDGSVSLEGELKTWHNVVLTLDGPFAHERDNAPNPFVDQEMNVRFTHESGSPSYLVPGYFAADGQAGESSAESGTKWRAHLSPDVVGQWSYTIEFAETAYDGTSGNFEIVASDKGGRDLRGKGRLQYVGQRYLQFAESGEWFLKVGADAPETLLAFEDFDNTVAHSPQAGPLKSWAPHLGDWKEGDPTWKDGRGKGLIGAINYLAGKEMNAFSFLTYNAGGDGDNVWPHLSRSHKLHFDCSKLDQWEVVFSHGTAQGMFLHFKLQETENDDLVGKGKGLEHALDDGELGIERKTYLREMIARFGHHLALNWNVGEENTQTFAQSSAMTRYIRQVDPYGHHVVLHTYPHQQDKVYGDYLGKSELLTGLSIQNSDVSRSHAETVKWINQSAASGHPWVIAIDEPGNASVGTPPDPDWPGMSEALEMISKKKGNKRKFKAPSIHDIRAEVLWGILLAGGTGVEHYFGYQVPENDLKAEDWRSREQTWEYSRIALEFFREEEIPFWEMKNANGLIGNPNNENGRYCFAKPGELYLVYLRQAKPRSLDLSEATGSFQVSWFNPRIGGDLETGSVATVEAGKSVGLGKPPRDHQEDWLVVVRKL